MLLNDLWTCLYCLYGRLDMRWNYVLLPSLALVQLCAVRPLCQQQLQVPGVEETLGQLYHVLSMAQ